MSEEKKYKNYTAADIEKYHKGLLSSKEMNELEKAAVEDPFLAEALEGYGAVRTNSTADLGELQKRLEDRISNSKVISIAPGSRVFKWWKAAAAVIVLGGLGFLTFKLSTNQKQNSVAEIDKKKQEQPASINVDSNKLTAVDSTSMTKNVKATETVTETRSTKKVPARAKSQKTDTSSYGDGLLTSRTSAISEVAKDKEYKSDSVNNVAATETHAATAPVAQKKAEARVAQPAGVVNDEQTAQVQSKINNFTGRVVDASSNAVPFANITVTRSHIETYADVTGYFSLTSRDSILKVRVRSVGFENGAMDLKNNTYNQVVLKNENTVDEKVLAFRNSESRAAHKETEQTEPVDGWINYNRYMANNIILPADLRIDQGSGQVQVSFDVNDNGEPVNLKVDKSLCKKCDEEAVRLVKQGPKWKKSSNAGRGQVTVPFYTKVK